MQKTLTILRHAEAKPAVSGQGDHERPLSAHGIHEAGMIAAYLKQAQFHPSHVLCSTSTRTRQTCEALPLAPASIQYTQAIYLASAKQLLALIRDLPDDAQSAMLIGHNPGMHSLCLMLAGSGERDAMAQMAVSFPTCTLATFTFEVPSWKQVTARAGVLQDFVVPAALTGA